MNGWDWFFVGACFVDVVTNVITTTITHRGRARLQRFMREQLKVIEEHKALLLQLEATKAASPSPAPFRPVRVLTLTRGGDA